MRARLLTPLLALLIAAAVPPLPSQLNNPKTTEGWIWQRVQAGEVADLNNRCDTPPLSIYQSKDPLWRAPCRRVDPVLLRALLTQPDLADHAPHGVRIRGARIEGDLELRDARARATEVWLGGSWITGGADLSDARLDGVLSLDGALIEGNLNAQRAVIGSTLSIRDAVFGGSVQLGDARIDGQMSVTGASVAAEQTFDAHRLHVGAGGLSLSNVTFGGLVTLRGAHIDGQMSLTNASIADKQTFDAERLHVGSDFFARSVTFGGSALFRFLTIDGGLDLRDSHMHQLDLGGTAVRDDLVLGGRFDDGSEHWLRWDSCDGAAPCLNLRNVRVGNLQDDVQAWPERSTLEGFTYAHLGGFGGERRQDMRNRPIEWWRGWLRRDPVYSAQPYAQLASVLAAAGNRDGAADIRFFGRDRERSELLRGCTWLQELGLADKPDDDRPCSWGAGLGLSALQVFVGHGIGAYTFRAAGWGLVLALIGTIILCFSPGVRGVRPVQFLTKATRAPRQKSLLWCFGASLQRVLPLVTLSAEFSDFFNDPRRERLRAWQHVSFGVLVLCGWALAGFVAAAFSGLIQN